MSVSRGLAAVLFACTIASAGVPTDAEAAEHPELNEDTLGRFARSRMESIKKCYERGLKLNPRLAGRVMVRFAVRTDGSTGDVVCASNTLKSRRVAACVVREVDSWNTPFRPSEPVTVEYPFVFQPVSG